ncbi:hypothetical protein [Thalassomonas actiniarum]|uniref:Uncharacterized protein n=1 Tax=Thalassomonas actiniarum TaxID=485447 RepID=A0AAE9YRQ0_9GAMM|nr:hypothetical protein [Thalassomonas actiniarum]WDD99063.1 hypothetical protein SG35_028250 [Thalassomonas actiniarum]
MIEVTTELLFVIALTIVFFVMAIATFCFIRISGKHIEREMKKEGKLPPGWDSTMGLRYGFYAITIVRNSVAPMSFVDDEAVLRHARKKDRYLALFLVISSTVLMIIGGLVYFLYVP